MGTFILVSNVVITSLQMSQIVNESPLTKDMYTNWNYKVQCEDLLQSYP